MRTSSLTSVSRLLILFFTLSLIASCSSTSKQSNAEINENSEKGPYEQLEESDNKPPTVVGYDNYYDPLEPINRPIFYVNNFLYANLLSPFSQAYNYVVPTVVDNSIANFFSNLREPQYSASYFLRGDFSTGGTSLLRLVINSTVGIFGLFDPAQAWMGLEEKKGTLGDALAYYGVGYGFYIMIPLLGPSDLRNAASMGAQYYLHPLNYVQDSKTVTYLFVFEGVHSEVPRLAEYPAIMEPVDDRYTYLRNLYLQTIQRDARAIRDGDFIPAAGRQEKVKERTRRRFLQ